MAGYAKMWTVMLHNEQFLSLSMNQRGMYTQLILFSKEQRDDGTVSFRSWTGLGEAMGCDTKTARKSLGVLREKSLLEYNLGTSRANPREKSRKSPGEIPLDSRSNRGGPITIIIPNYKTWQDLTADGVREKSRKSPGEIPPLKLDYTKPNQTKLKDDIPYSEIIEHLNKIVGTKYKPNSEKTKSLIRARWSEGFRLADFQTVHNSKFLEWKDDPKMITYLRPETLYSPKFEGYLNQKEVTDPNKAFMAEMTKKYG